MAMIDKLVFNTAGWSGQNELWFAGAGRHECGTITDGVVIGHDNDPGFVLDFKDLETMYNTAKAYRDRCPETE